MVVEEGKAAGDRKWSSGPLQRQAVRSDDKPSWPSNRHRHESGLCRRRRSDSEASRAPYQRVLPHLLHCQPPPPSMEKVPRAIVINFKLCFSITCKKCDAPHTLSIAFLQPGGSAV